MRAGRSSTQSSIAFSRSETTGRGPLFPPSQFVGLPPRSCGVRVPALTFRFSELSKPARRDGPSLPAPPTENTNGQDVLDPRPQQVTRSHSNRKAQVVPASQLRLVARLCAIAERGPFPLLFQLVAQAPEPADHDLSAASEIPQWEFLPPANVVSHVPRKGGASSVLPQPFIFHVSSLTFRFSRMPQADSAHEPFTYSTAAGDEGSPNP